MHDFDLPEKKHSNKGRQPDERKVIRGIIYKKCALCGDWRPLADYHCATGRYDHKQGYCPRCKSYYDSWRRAMLKKHNVRRLKDVPGYTYPMIEKEVLQYMLRKIRKENNGGQKDE